METIKSDFEKQISELIEKYGRLDFFEKALGKQKVTRHMIVQAKGKNFYTSIFFYLVSVVVFAFGLTSYFDIRPKEFSFLIPISIVMFGAIYAHARKVRRALRELSKLAVGIHAKKLTHDY